MAASGASPKTKPVTVRFTIQPASLVTTLIEVAISEKFFSSVGIDARTVVVANGPAAVTALASGSVDVATNAPEVFLALVDKGQALQLFSGQTRQVGVLVARPGFAVASDYTAAMQSLRGKKVGVTALSSATQYMAITMLQGAGLSASDVQFVAVGNGGPAALENGVVDAAMLFGAQIVVTETLGGHAMADLRTVANCPAPMHDLCGIGQIGLWGTSEWIAKNPDIVAKIRKAIALADVFLHDPANAAAARRILLTHLPGDSSDAVKQAYVADALTIITAAFARADLERWIAIDRGAKVISHEIPIASVYADGTPGDQQQVKALAQ